ncbi:MAG: heme exporter protein CcmD [Proteobacteria bacterium]|nr:heme exporter protein CcmD [Pseudomonadota bacterium]
MYGEGISAVPYIVSAYGICLALVLGYAAWLVLHRRKTTMYLSTLSAGDQKADTPSKNKKG